MSVSVTVYGGEGCWKCANTCTALTLAGIAFEVVDVHSAGLVDELRGRGVLELPYVVTSTGESWTGLRFDKIVDLRMSMLTGPPVAAGRR